MVVIYRGSKSAKVGVIFNVAQLWGTGAWKCSKISELWNKSVTKRWSSYVLIKFGDVRSTQPWEPFGESAPSRNTGRRKCAISSITQPYVDRFPRNLSRWCEAGIRRLWNCNKKLCYRKEDSASAVLSWFTSLSALFSATYGLDIPDFSNCVYPVPIEAVLVIY